METDSKRPNAALVNREWFESAKSVLNRGQIKSVVCAAVEYVLYGSVDDTLDEMERIVFAMVKPALDSDIVKYAERCERNQRNARSQSQRVAPSGTQSQRVGAITTTTTTTTPTTTTTTTPSISPEERENIEKWIIFGYFWSTGSRAIKEEAQAFWSYYEALGWKNNKGAPIVSKLAAARMWRRQFETGAVPDGAAEWFKALQGYNITSTQVFLCYAGAERQGDIAVVRLRCSPKFYADLTAEAKRLEIDLAAAWHVQGIRIEYIQ